MRVCESESGDSRFQGELVGRLVRPDTLGRAHLRMQITSTQMDDGFSEPHCVVVCVLGSRW